MKYLLLIMLIIMLLSCDDMPTRDNLYDTANPLNPVTNLTASVPDEGAIIISWSYTGPVSSFKIDRREVDGDWHTSFAIVPGTLRAYSDTQVILNQIYYYRVSVQYDQNISPATEVTKQYSLVVANPEITPPGGTFNNVLTVAISCSTIRATIRYTMDGPEPTENSTQYTGAISISSTTTLKAKAFKTGWAESGIGSATYTIIPANFVFVQGGTFNNGTSNVTLSSFYIDKYEVSQASYQAVMGTNPSSFSGNPNRPVEVVSWFNTIEYCNRRSIQEGLTPAYSYSAYSTNPDNWPAGWNTSDGNQTNVSCNWSANGYRLPTEMEWMFTAKGGNQSQGYTYSGSNTIGNVAWYDSNSGYRTHDVGELAANEIGTFDMSGNVWEWVWDIWANYPSGNQTNPTGPVSGAVRVLRGGTWINDVSYCNVSKRYNAGATSAYSNIGFRVLRVSP